jgi:hypothetical protein
VLGSVGAVSVASALTPQSQAEAISGPTAAATTAAVSAEPAFEILLKVGPAHSAGADGLLTAAIVGGTAEGKLLTGAVQPGRVDWRSDSSSSMVEITASFGVLRENGELVQLRDRSVYPAAVAPATLSSLPSSPEMLDASGDHALSPTLLVGRLDATGFAAGHVKLSVFRVV